MLLSSSELMYDAIWSAGALNEPNSGILRDLEPNHDLCISSPTQLSSSSSELVPICLKGRRRREVGEGKKKNIGENH